MSRSRSAAIAATLFVVVMIASATAGAVVPLYDTYGGTRGFGLNCLSHNDDGSSAVIDLTPAFPYGLQFFTATHTTGYVNTNGNITFSGALPQYTPEAFPVASQPMIAPYWADVDIRYMFGSCRGGAGTSEPGYLACENPPENGVWWYMEPGLMVITWDAVGYYSCNMDLRMSFQLLLTAAEGCAAPGDFDVEFRFNRCEWTTGDASGGSGGFGGTPAQAGFDAGNSVDFVEVPGSRTSTIHTIMCNDSNVGEPGVWRYQIRSGMIVCPEAGMPCDTGLQGECANGLTQCVGSGTECVQVVFPTEERCDALDNDCDGETDEGDGLCLSWEVCSLGNCVERCSEFGCPTGQICTEDDWCIDAECVDVVCDPGERCVDGVCMGACDGIACPWGLQCRGGRCVDLCESLTCDECTVCEEGVCVPNCIYEDCPAGYTCDAEGHCIEDACVGVTCPPGEHCSGGACVDNCLGAVCPSGEVCEAGECVTYEEPEPDPYPEIDPGADTAPDTAPDVAPDGTTDAGDAADDTSLWPGPTQTDEMGCGCGIVR